MISLSSSNNAYDHKSLPQASSFIAPYWADTDLRGTGQVYYRQTKDPVLLARATNEIQTAFPLSKNVVVTNLLIATWDAVGYYLKHTDKVRTYMQLVCMYVCMYVYMHVRMYECMYICMYVHCMYLCMHVHMYVVMCGGLYMYVCMYVCRYIHTYVAM